MNTRSGQASLEYLFTYGWAFLAILLTIGSLAYFGVFNLDNFRGESCSFPPGISCVDYALSDDIGPTPALFVNVRNLHGADLNLTNAVARSDITGEIGCELESGSIPSDGAEWNFETVLNISCDITDAASYVSRQNYDFVMNLEFVQRGQTYEHTTTGLLRVRAQ